MLYDRIQRCEMRAHFKCKKISSLIFSWFIILDLIFGAETQAKALTMFFLELGTASKERSCQCQASSNGQRSTGSREKEGRKPGNSGQKVQIAYETVIFVKFMYFQTPFMIPTLCV